MSTWGPRGRVYYTGGVISSLNQRLFLIKRFKHQVNPKQLQKVANSIWTSKLRYGLQIYSKVRTQDDIPNNASMEALQKAQNKILRVLEGVYLRDRVSTNYWFVLTIEPLFSFIKSVNFKRIYNLLTYLPMKDTVKTQQVKIERWREKSYQTKINSCLIQLSGYKHC